MNGARGMRRPALAAAALFALAGCAVLQIDVDVYKGPLANHEEVQTQQMAALAIGAKPLLTQLRDILEWPDPSQRLLARKNDGRGNDENYDDGNDGNTYADGYMRSRFCSEQAGRVNAVLSLYENNVDQPRIELALGEVQTDTRKYLTLNKKLNPNPKQDEKDWEAIKSGLKEGVDIDVKKLDEEGKQKTFDSDIEFLQDLMDPDSRSKGLPELIQEFQRLLDPVGAGETSRRVGLIEEISRILEGDKPDFKKSNPDDVPTNTRFKNLKDRKKIKRFRELLFKDPNGKEARLFEKRVVEIADSFLDGRMALRERWLNLIDMLIVVNTDRTYGDRRAKIPDAQRQAITNALAASIAESVQHRRLAFAMTALGSSPTVKELKETLARLAPRSFWEIGRAGKPYGDWNPASYEIGNRTVARALQRDPVAVARLLLAVDEAFIGAEKKDLVKFAEPVAEAENKFKRYVTKDARKYGVIRGPYQISMKSISKGDKNVADQTAALGLDRGRRDEGIYTLTETYLRLLAKPERNLTPEGEFTEERCVSPQICGRQNRLARNGLLDALVRFSEKVLVIANNEVLFRDADEGALFRKVDGTCMPVRDRKAPRSTKPLDKYVLVLQAVGNSILIQANELRQREGHDEKFKQRAGPEIQALERALSRSPETIIDDLLIGLKADRGRLTTQLEEGRAEIQQAMDRRSTASTTLISTQGEWRGASDAKVKACMSDERAKHEVKTILAAYEVVRDKDDGPEIERAARAADALIPAPPSPEIPTQADTTGTCSPPNEPPGMKIALGASERNDVTPPAAAAPPSTTPPVPPERKPTPPGTSSSGQIMVRGIAKWLDDEFHKFGRSVRDQERPQRLRNAWIFFVEYYPNAASIKSDDKDNDFEAILKDVVKNYEQAWTRLTSTGMTRSDADRSLGTAAAELQSAARGYKAAEKDIEVAKASVEPAQTEETRVIRAIKVVEMHRAEVVGGIRASNTKFKPSEVYARLIAMLKDKRKTAMNESAVTPPGEQENLAAGGGGTSGGGGGGISGGEGVPILPTELADAVGVLEDRSPPNDPMVFNDTWFTEPSETWDPKHPSGRDVLDTLIASLRHEHIEATRETGPDKGRAPNIAAALKVAYEQRAGMAYIRPSSAYLRSSYPSTSLQDDPGLAWQNMLTGHAKRSFPLLGGVFANPPSDGERRRITREIDKQFWQSINQVRVAGAGATNYVIAKDDIGNWYVKAYSANPEDIIKSAQKLALFNIGAQMDANLLRRIDEQADGQQGDILQTPLERLFKKHFQKYAGRTQTDFNAAKAAIVDPVLEGKIETAWSSSGALVPDQLKQLKGHFAVASPHLKAAREAMANDSGKDDVKPEIKAQRPARILGTLASLVSFHAALTAQIRAQPLMSDAETLVTARTKVQREAAKTLQEAELDLSKKKSARLEAQVAVLSATTSSPTLEADFKTKTIAVDDAEKVAATAKGNLDTENTALTNAIAALEAAKKDQATALATVTSVVLAELQRFVKRREDAIEELETAIAFIGEAAQPAKAKDKQEKPAPTFGALPQTTTPSESAAPGAELYKL